MFLGENGTVTLHQSRQVQLVKYPGVGWYLRNPAVNIGKFISSLKNMQIVQIMNKLDVITSALSISEFLSNFANIYCTMNYAPLCKSIMIQI